MVKIFNIKTPKSDHPFPVKVLHETENLILHRPINRPLDSKDRCYVITCKDKAVNYMGELVVADMSLNFYIESKISELKNLMGKLEANFDLEAPTLELQGNRKLQAAVKSLK